ncbi:hypothetical protein CLBKND_03184 [Methylorubrum aminovorans]
MAAYTLKKIQAMSPIQRARLRANAVKIGGSAGHAIVPLIDDSGLPLSLGGMPTDHPTYQEMDRLIKSVEGRALAIKATEEMLP